MGRRYTRKNMRGGFEANWVGEPGKKYKVFEITANTPEEYKFIGTLRRSVPEEDGMVFHEFENVRMSNGEDLAERVLPDSSIGTLYTIRECGAGECGATGGRRRRRTRRHRRRVTRR